MNNKSTKNMSGKRSRMEVRSRVKLTAKTLRVFIASFVILIAAGTLIFINLSDRRSAYAAVLSGDYRSVASGNWNSTSTWEKYNGSAWVAAVTTPTSSDGAITIQSGHTVTIIAPVTVDQVNILAGGQVALNSGVTLTINAGTGTDFDVYGIFKNAGTVSLSGSPKLFFENGGKYQHNFTVSGGTIPASTWKVGSTCEIIGYTTNTSNPGGFSQAFQNFTWNCTNQTAAINFGGGFPNVSGDLTISSTGSSSIQFDYQGNNTTLNIGGNLYIQGGTTYGCTNGAVVVNVTGNYIQTNGTFAFDAAGGTAYGNQSMIMNLTGNINISGGTMDLSQCTANNASKGAGAVNLSGNIILSGTGLLTESSVDSRGQVYFSGSGVQQSVTAATGTITQKVDFVVNAGAILKMDNQILGGAGDFSLLNGGGLMIGDANGITVSTASGNIQCTGSRTYSSGGDYTYNGAVAQNSGDGLPATIHNFTLNNNNNLTLTNSTSVSNVLTMSAGLFVTSGNTLTLGTSTSTLGTLSRSAGHVVGNFRRWIAAAATSNILFPVGTLSYYNAANLSFTVAPTAGTITAAFIPANPGTLGFPITDAGISLSTIGYGYWSFTTANGFSGGTYNVNLYANGFPGILNYTDLHIVRRAGSGSPWTLDGTHSAGTGSNSAAVANRTGMTLSGHYGIGSAAGNPLPVKLVYFKASLNNKYVDLSWTTASEINNDFFTVERSSDAMHFEEILKKQGAGNSTSTLYYTATDLNPITGYSYYRLKQTDYDGHFSYSKIETVDNKNKEEAELKITQISPIPFQDHFQLFFNTKSKGIVEIQLTNSFGQVVSKDRIEAAEGINQFDYAGKKELPEGIYFINLIYNGEKISQKIIKS
jgi:hypothetical protein